MSPGKFEVEDLSPLAVAQLKLLCTRVHEGSRMDGELREIQTSLSAEIATLKGKIEQTERAAKDLSYSNGDGRNQKQIDTFGEEIQALQKRLEFLGKKSAAIFDERKAFNLWLPAAKRVQGRLFDALGFEHYDLFPTLSPYSRKLPAGEVIG